MSSRREASLPVRTPPGGWRRLTIGIAGAGALAVTLDSAVNIAFPAIATAFGVSVGAIQWVVVSYIVTFGAGLVPAGRLADRLGPGRVFRVGLVVSGVAFGLCGAAPTFGGLLAARALQGAGAALVFAGAPALVTLAAPEALRGRALGWFNFVTTSGMVVGPLAAGVLVDAWGWPVVYWARVPLAAGALLVAWTGLREATTAVDAAPRHAAPPTLGAIADRGRFVIANLAHLLAQAALFAIWLLVPFDLLLRRGLAPAWGGLVFAACPLAWALATPLGGVIADRGGARWIAPLALGIEALGLLGVGALGAAAPAWAVAAVLALAGAGLGLFVVPNMHYVMGALPASAQGTAGSLVTLMRTAGVVLGAHLTARVYEARLVAHAAVGPDPAGAAFADAFRVAAALAAAAALLGLLGRRTRG